MIVKKQNKRKLGVILLVLLSSVFCLGLAFGFVQSVHASAEAALAENSDAFSKTNPPGLGPGAANSLVPDGSTIAGWFLNAIITILYWIFWFIGKLLMLAMYLLDKMININALPKLLTGKAVSTGWMLVRDFINLFFVLMLLFVAICTILRIDRYGIKQMLTKVLAAALLINFSKPITLFLIDFSQLAMNFFADNLSPNGESFTKEMADLIGIQYVFTNAHTIGLKWSGTIAISLLAGIVFMFILAAMIFLLAISLIYRMVAFVVLIILSPLAFAGLALPGTPIHAAWSRWISRMTGWMFFGPTLLFFLWLALVVMRESTGDILGAQDSFKSMMSTVSAQTPQNPTFQGTINNQGDIESVVSGIMARTIPFAVAIYLLYYGYDLSKALAAQAGKSVGGLMERGEGHITRWAKRVGKGSVLASGTVATLGGVAGYYAGKSIQKRTSDRYAAIKSGYKKRIFGDDEKRKGRNEEIEAKLAGGKHWDDFTRKKAKEKVKKWEDGDLAEPTDQEREAMEKSTNEVDRKAAALHTLRKGKAKNGDHLNDLLAVAGTDKDLRKEFMKEANKKNFAQVVDYKDKHERPKELEEFIAKKRKEYEDQGFTYTDNMANTDRGNFNLQYKQKLYDEKLKTMTLNDMKEQNDDFHNSLEFAKYMKQNMGANKRFTANDVRKFATRNLSENKFAAWEKAKLFED